MGNTLTLNDSQNVMHDVLFINDKDKPILCKDMGEGMHQTPK